MPHVLVAEDNRINQIVVIGLLQRLGYEVDIAHTGTEAVAACLAKQYDAVLMDVMMPEMDGYQATVTIRDNEIKDGLPHVPVIGLSARAMAGDHEIALAAGMDEYLTKPIHLPHLRLVLDRCVSAILDS